MKEINIQNDHHLHPKAASAWIGIKFTGWQRHWLPLKEKQKYRAQRDEDDYWLGAVIGIYCCVS
jgi:hypothetical protein